MGGQIHQSTGSLYDQAGTTSDAGEAVMARWLQSTGLQHLGNSGIDHRLLPNLLSQGYGAQSAEEKQRLFKFLKNLNLNGDGTESYAPSTPSLGLGSNLDGFYSPELRGEFGAGLLDLHAVDDTELLSENVMSEPFETSPFMPAVSKGFDNDFDPVSSRYVKEQNDALRLSTTEKDGSSRDVAKIKVVVRKRPLNKKELGRKEEDIVTVCENSCLTVHETKLKVDLTAYVEKHEFCFDAVLDEHVNNDEVYRVTVEPIIPTIFERTKATCFAYGQTGSGKTYTMQPLPLRACEDIVHLLRQPVYRNQKFKLWLSFFEIYGGKLYDLLSERRKLCMREDGRQQVCIVGLQEFEVSDVQIVKEYIEKGNASRSTGSTGANEESSRSHAILQLAIKKHNNDPKNGKLVGKISFIDLAGSERGADTTDNDRQTRIEGAEINKSLLALKECIRALDNDQIHIPFRGSKLTEVLRDSFVGNSKTVMISCISPNTGSCEHTLNTLRYADRVKSLSKSSNSKKDQMPNSSATNWKDVSTLPVSPEIDDFNDQIQDARRADIARKGAESSYNGGYNFERHSSGLPPNFGFNGREDPGMPSGSLDKDRADFRETLSSSTANQRSYSANASDVLDEEKIRKVSPTRRKVPREEKLERQNIPKRESRADVSMNYKQQYQHDLSTTTSGNTSTSKQYDNEPQLPDVEIDALLEEEESLIAAHRKEIEDTMDIVREEMKLLAEVDQPGSQIDNYVTQLSFVLSRKAAGLVSLQARLARFQHRLKEQEILSRKKAPR